MKDFNYWKKLHESEKFEEFSSDSMGLLWLKTKSIIRKDLIPGFTQSSGVLLNESSLSLQFIELFRILSKNPTKSHQILDEFIRKVNAKQVEALNTKELVSELYKIKTFDWGGDY